jgi:HAD superfamily hydrolase (TIGR01509 family)
MPPASWKAVKAALLDFDMTMVDSVPTIVMVTNLFADRVGRPRVTPEKVMESIALPFEDTWVEFWGSREPGWTELYRELYKDLETEGLALFPDTLETLRKLKAASIKTAVVTNRWMAKKAVESAGIAGYIDAVVGADEVAKPKPDPEPVARALQLLGAEPGEAVYVGDTVEDVLAGVGAGVAAVGVTTGPSDRKALTAAGASLVIDRLGELPAVLGL